MVATVARRQPARPLAAGRGAAAGGARQLAAEEAALRRLVLQCEDGDAVALVVVERVVPRLMLFLRRRFPGLTEDDAYDAAAEALRVAIERRATFDAARTTRVRTWLYGIAVIKAADSLRRRGNQVPLTDDVAAQAHLDRGPQGRGGLGAAMDRQAPSGSCPAAAAASAGSAEAEAVRRALLALPEQQRKAALARYVEGLPPAEIDRRYGWKPNTAHVYLSLARKAIRRRLAAAGAPRGAAAASTRRGGGEEVGSTGR